MYYDNLKNKSNIINFKPLVEKCIRFAKENDLASFEKGRYEIDGKKAYLNIEEFETADVKDRGFEGHRKYIDIHMILKGSERIDVNDIANMTSVKFLEANDFEVFEGEASATVILHPYDYLICDASDIHRPGIAVNEKETVKKAVFKIIIE